MALASLPLPDDVSSRIRYARRELRRWSQKDLAEATRKTGCEVTEPQVQRIENGQWPDIGQLLALATALGYTVRQLGASESVYPEISLFERMGWQSDQILEQIRCLRNSRPDLRLVLSVPPVGTPK